MRRQTSQLNHHFQVSATTIDDPGREEIFLFKKEE